MTTFFSYKSFIAGVVVGILLSGIWFLSSNPALLSATTDQTASTVATSTGAQSGAVAVSDQAAGTAVLIDSVTVPPPGVWIAVREMNGTDLGNVLGALRVGNPQSNVSVPLLRATEPGRDYAVELYRDDNGGAFDPSVNSVYVDFDTGARVVEYFKTTEAYGD